MGGGKSRRAVRSSLPHNQLFRCNHTRSFYNVTRSAARWLHPLGLLKYITFTLCDTFGAGTFSHVICAPNHPGDPLSQPWKEDPPGAARWPFPTDDQW